jgi:hypothetical protein
MSLGSCSKPRRNAAQRKRLTALGSVGYESVPAVVSETNRLLLGSNSVQRQAFAFAKRLS